MSPVREQLDGSGRLPDRVSFYIDESKGNRWLYIGLLAVLDSERDRLVEALVGDRARVGYTGELHFSEITTVQKRRLGERWLTRALYPSNPLVRFRLLGIDTHAIQQKHFGVGRQQQDESIYRWCLRKSLLYTTKTFFAEDTVVTAIVHDDRSLSADEYFHWHTPWRLRQEGLRIGTDEIRFLDSDHRRSGTEESQLIQFVDLLIGLSRACLDEDASRQPHRRQLALQWLPLAQALTQWPYPWKKRREYHLERRLNFGFFPKTTWTGPGCPENPFYRERECALAHADQLTML